MMRTLKLFNAVVAKPFDSSLEGAPFISEEGLVIEAQALWAKEQIIHYYQEAKLNGFQLNQTFHKSWKKIKESSRFELMLEQIKHYCSTYGSNFEAQIYIPEEVLNIPDLELSLTVIKAYTRSELEDKCLKLLTSGVALKEETIDDLLSILVDDLDYRFTGEEAIRNKEAIVKIAQVYGVIPKDTLDFFRYVILMATGQSLLIKSPEVIKLIRESSFNPAAQFVNHGLNKLAEIFNRFKPLFLAFKTKCPKTINKISKLSKKHHKPLSTNPLNQVTTRLLTEQDAPWLKNATIFALFKALSVCHSRIQGQSNFVYRIRNGKSWAKASLKEDQERYLELNQQNYQKLLAYLKTRIQLSGVSVYIPENTIFALPTSEKTFVGKLPTGTRIFAKQMAIGIYWRNEWGASDLDLSGLNIGGKVGWNASYSQSGNLMYSGDMTNATNGAVEYLYAKDGLQSPTLVINQVYSGSSTSSYKIIIGQGDQITYDYMMNPNHLLVETLCQSVQNKMILGILIPTEDGQSFVVLNFGAGQNRVSGSSKISQITTNALYQQWSAPLSFNDLLIELGAHRVDDPELADYSFELNTLEIDSFFKIFERKDLD